MLLLIKVLTLKALCPEWASQCFIVTLTILNTPKRYESIGLIAKLSDDDVEKTAEFGNYEPNAFYNANLSPDLRGLTHFLIIGGMRRYGLRLVLYEIENSYEDDNIYIYLRTGIFFNLGFPVPTSRKYPTCKKSGYGVNEKTLGCVRRFPKMRFGAYIRKMIFKDMWILGYFCLIL